MKKAVGESCTCTIAKAWVKEEKKDGKRKEEEETCADDSGKNIDCHGTWFPTCKILNHLWHRN